MYCQWPFPLILLLCLRAAVRLMQQYLRVEWAYLAVHVFRYAAIAKESGTPWGFPSPARPESSRGAALCLVKWCQSSPAWMIPLHSRNLISFDQLLHPSRRGRVPLGWLCSARTATTTVEKTLLADRPCLCPACFLFFVID